jgi:hypothetical protein
VFRQKSPAKRPMNPCIRKLHKLSIYKSSNSVHGCGKGAGFILKIS